MHAYKTSAFANYLFYTFLLKVQDGSLFETKPLNLGLTMYKINCAAEKQTKRLQELKEI